MMIFSKTRGYNSVTDINEDIMYMNLFNMFFKNLILGWNYPRGWGYQKK